MEQLQSDLQSIVLKQNFVNDTTYSDSFMLLDIEKALRESKARREITNYDVNFNKTTREVNIKVQETSKIKKIEIKFTVV